jgi:hypothetical protein
MHLLDGLWPDSAHTSLELPVPPASASTLTILAPIPAEDLRMTACH